MKAESETRFPLAPNASRGGPSLAASVSHSPVSPPPHTPCGAGNPGQPEAVDFWPVSFIPYISSTSATGSWLILLTADLQGSRNPEKEKEGRHLETELRPRLPLVFCPSPLSLPTLP
ncbi:unnamed protein product [Pipistrellus nathusii]|uniref:Uncharacterized protein n=1 Tax=Pipistrellus nathusii TaxID=59473 RepID=A0ABP0A233_PIPNA